jgi:tetratricopeptide (TPR) repeat protein
MKAFAPLFKQTFTALSLTVAIAFVSLPVMAQPVDLSADLDLLLEELANPETQNWQQVERQIRNEWSKSGSTAMDLLLQRGEKALEAKEYDKAIEHLTALTDHAPDFAEGWNARATAYFHKKLYGPAMDDIGHALALNPRHFGALTGLAVILQDVGMTAEAQKAWQMVRALHPHREEIDQALEALGRLNGEQEL